MITDIQKQGSLIECVLNVSEGRNLQVLDNISTAVNTTDGASVIHRDIGYDAHRTVFTIVGNPKGVFESIDKIFAIAADNIKMADHQGTHPCTGALDVIPIVPIRDIDITNLKHQLTSHAKIWSERYNLPICYYDSMARNSTQVTLAQIRKGGYHQLEDRITQGLLKIDVGPDTPHPQLGLSSCTVRPFMSAYNINLDTADLATAKQLASLLRKQRSSNPKTKEVRFLGWYVDEYKCTQISTNIYDIDAISMEELYHYVDELARSMNSRCMGSELIGLIPLRGLTRQTGNYKIVADEIGLNSVSSFNPAERILEKVLGIPTLAKV